jgi:hypothetical protein
MALTGIRDTNCPHSSSRTKLGYARYKNAAIFWTRHIASLFLAGLITKLAAVTLSYGAFSLSSDI